MGAPTDWLKRVDWYYKLPLPLRSGEPFHLRDVLGITVDDMSNSSLYTHTQRNILRLIRNDYDERRQETLGSAKKRAVKLQLAWRCFLPCRVSPWCAKRHPPPRGSCPSWDRHGIVTRCGVVKPCLVLGLARSCNSNERKIYMDKNTLSVSIYAGII